MITHGSLEPLGKFDPYDHLAMMDPRLRKSNEGKMAQYLTLRRERFKCEIFELRKRKRKKNWFIARQAIRT